MSRAPRSRIGRAPSAFQLVAVPIGMTMLASLAPLLPNIASVPLLPPFGLMALICWRLVHRNLWPAWIALPLGLWDDMWSGQPLGSAMLLWTLVMFGIDVLDRRMIWRDFIQDWGLASAIIAAVLIAGLAIANATGGAAPVRLILPQIAVSIGLYPLVALICGRVDKWRVT